MPQLDNSAQYMTRISSRNEQKICEQVRNNNSNNDGMSHNLHVQNLNNYNLHKYDLSGKIKCMQRVKPKSVCMFDKPSGVHYENMPIQI